jgi:hypothetical protein
VFGWYTDLWICLNHKGVNSRWFQNSCTLCIKRNVYSVNEFWRRMVAFPRFLIRTSSWPTYLSHNPISGSVVRYHNVSIVFWKYKPCLVIGNLYMSSIFVSFTNTFLLHEFRIFSFAEFSFIWTLLCFGLKLFISASLWRLCGFHHKENSVKTEVAVCVMAINQLLDNAMLQGTRRLYECFL